MWVIFSVILLAALGWMVKLLVEAQKREMTVSQELDEHKRQYGPIEAAHRQLADLTRQLSANKAELDALGFEYVNLDARLEPLRREDSLLNSGFTPITYEFPDSKSYQTALEKLREKQKTLIKEGKAVNNPGFTVDNDAKAGARVTRDLSSMMLRAFNGECDALIARVSYKNFEASKKKMQACLEQLNKLGKNLELTIKAPYAELRLRELALVYEYLELKYEEAEEQKAIRERIREEERATREFQRAQDEAEQEERRWSRALKLAETQLATSTGTIHAELAAKVAELQGQLKTAQTAKQRAISMAQKTRAGHVYVISNVGSFGENVYKVGMTRRLEPLDRVDELGSASVPFRFDVHALIYSEDAPALEHKLHTALAASRVNKVNPRKEFFNTSLAEIESLVNNLHGRFRLTHAAEAKEYRETTAMPSATPSAAPRPSAPFQPTSFGRQGAPKSAAPAEPSAIRF